ncbi:hypothetical protein GC174_11495 [bacterium]|nr:hypothetical protein [bacterium]
MNNLVSTMAFATPLLVLAFACPQAQAQGGIYVDTSKLEKVKPFQGRRKIYVLDETPEIIDHRRPKEGPNLLRINIPAVPQGQGTVTDVNLPSLSNGGGNGGGGSVVIDTNQLPQSGFESNMGSLERRNNLPGTKMGVMQNKSVTGHMKPPANGDQRPLRIRPNPTSTASASSMPVTLKYKDPGSANGGAESSSRTKVTGEVTSRTKPVKHSLLKGGR